MKIPGLGFLVMLAALFPAPLCADVIKGEIIAVGEDARSFDLKADEESGQKEDLKVWLLTETRFKGLSALSELKKGDEVAVQAQHNTSNNRWEADEVELTKVSIGDPGAEVPVSQQLGEEKADRLETAETAAAVVSPVGAVQEGPK